MTNGPDFVATDFDFYNCNRYQQCSECVSAPFPCDWCVDGHRCTHDTAENCRNDILVTGVKVRAGSTVYGWYVSVCSPVLALCCRSQVTCSVVGGRGSYLFNT